MSVSQATRTLVKSAPELWAEISNPEALARHFEQFGEIRITRAEPERTVAWEGERASGTVELEVSGWGTKVRLTARLLGEERAAAPALAAPEPEYLLPQPAPALTEPEPEPEPPVDAVSPAAEDVLVPAAPRRGLLARMFSRKHALAPLQTPASSAGESVPVPPAPEPEAAVAELPAAPFRLEPTRVAIGPIRVFELHPSAVPDPAARLEAVLDVLGTAHRRPFSRG